MLTMVVVVDFREKIIPNTINLFLLVWTLAYRLILATAGAQRWEDFGVAIGCAVGFGGLFWLVHIIAGWAYGQDAFGMGDVKFIFVMGLILGWPRILVAIVLAFGLGAIVGVVLIALNKGNRKMQLPFGPFLVAGLVGALVWGQYLWQILTG